MPDTADQEFVKQQRNRPRFQNGKADIVDVRPFQYERVPLQEAGGEGNYVIKGVLQRADAQNQNGRVYPKHILEREVERYKKEFINKNMAYGELDHPDCVWPRTKALTAEGWKSVEDVEVGEEVLTLNTDTREPEMQPVQSKTDEEYSGRMFRIKSRHIDTCVTPNHRFWILPRKDNVDQTGKWVTAQEIYENRDEYTKWRIPKIQENSWSYPESEEVVIPGVSVHEKAKNRLEKKYAKPLKLDKNSFYAFLGIWLADGHTTPKSEGYQVAVTQSVNRDAVRKLLTNLSEELSFREHEKDGDKSQFIVNDARLHSFLRQNFGTDCYEKRIPARFKKSASEKQLEELFEWFVVGDGTRFKQSDSGYERTRLFSTSERLLDDMQTVAAQLGHAGTRSIQEGDEEYEFADHTIERSNKHDLHVLNVSKIDSIGLDPRHTDIEPVDDYDGTVHCVTVENGTFYAMDNGKPFWSGNSSTVELKNASHIVRNVWWNGNDVMGEVQVLPTPMGNILRTLLDENLSIGISSRGMGSVDQKRDGTVVVNEDFQLIAWDFVSNPSTHGAFMGEKNLQEAAKSEANKQAMRWRPVEQFAQEVIAEMNDLGE